MSGQQNAQRLIRLPPYHPPGQNRGTRGDRGVDGGCIQDAMRRFGLQARGMSEDTPGTRPDPECIADGDSNQLPKEDTLIKRGVDDLLDEGYSPPERPSPSLKETAAEQNEPDTIAEREKQLTPEVWEEPPRSEEHTSELQSRGHIVC